jgi:hypothetical protein
MATVDEEFEGEPTTCVRDDALAVGRSVVNCLLSVTSDLDWLVYALWARIYRNEQKAARCNSLR